jgi:hypothetical protein
MEGYREMDPKRSTLRGDRLREVLLFFDSLKVPMSDTALNLIARSVIKRMQVLCQFLSGRARKNPLHRRNFFYLP